MKTLLYATPYNLAAQGFYFTNMDDYEAKSKCHLDAYGNLVEEYEMQYINGDDAALFNVCNINQANLSQWFDDIEFLQDHEKVSLYYLVAIAGYSLDQAVDKIDDPSIATSTLRDAAEELFDECYLVSDATSYYIDYDKFARDCRMGGDLVEFEYANTTYTCTNSNCL